MGISIIPEREYDNRAMIHATPRYRGTVTCFSSQDEDQADPSKVWGGANKIKYHHTIGSSLTHSFYLDFNTIDNTTYMFSGSFNWVDCNFDEVHVYIVPKVTASSAGVSTNFNLFGGYLIVPAAGDGTLTVNPADMQLVQVTRNEFGNFPAGYFDADYNTTTKVFENVVPNVNGTGAFNLFSVEVPFHKYVNNYVMLGNYGNSLTSYDADSLGHNIRLRFDFQTDGADHDWKFAGNIVLFRGKTI